MLHCWFFQWDSSLSTLEDQQMKYTRFRRSYQISFITWSQYSATVSFIFPHKIPCLLSYTYQYLYTQAWKQRQIFRTRPRLILSLSTTSLCNNVVAASIIAYIHTYWIPSTYSTEEYENNRQFFETLVSSLDPTTGRGKYNSSWGYLKWVKEALALSVANNCCK